MVPFIRNTKLDDDESWDAGPDWKAVCTLSSAFVHQLDHLNLTISLEIRISSHQETGLSTQAGKRAKGSAMGIHA